MFPLYFIKLTPVVLGVNDRGALVEEVITRGNVPKFCRCVPALLNGDNLGLQNSLIPKDLILLVKDLKSEQELAGLFLQQ